MINDKQWELKSYLKVENWLYRIENDVIRKSKRQCKNLVLSFQSEQEPNWTDVADGIILAAKRSLFDTVWLWDLFNPMSIPINRYEILKPKWKKDFIKSASRP